MAAVVPAFFFLVALNVGKGTDIVDLPVVENLLHETWEEGMRAFEYANCLSNNVTYKRMEKTKTRFHWRIPHTAITMDGVRCEGGEDRYTDVIKYDLLYSKIRAIRANLLRPYLRMTQGSHPARDLLATMRREFNASTMRQHVFVLFESRPRICGNVTVPEETLTILARIYDKALQIGRFIRSDAGNNLAMSLEKFTIYHIVIAPTTQGADLFCPYVTPKFRRKYSVRSCFPSNTQVRTLHHGWIPIDRLRVGDFVQSGYRVGDWTRVLMFTHRDVARVSEFVRIHSRGRKLTLSPGHLIDERRFAYEITEGHPIRLADGRTEVVDRVERVREIGLYSPQTSTGTIEVDGFKTLTYTSSLSYATAHASLTPLRMLNRLGAYDAVVWYGEILSHAADLSHWVLDKVLVHLGELALDSYK